MPSTDWKPPETSDWPFGQWAVTASASLVVALDNVSTVPEWLSDALCRAVTGDGLTSRALYSDADVSVLTFRRVLAMTSIDAGALRGDLGERLEDMLAVTEVEATRRRAQRLLRTGVLPDPEGSWPVIPWPPF